MLFKNEERLRIFHTTDHPLCLATNFSSGKYKFPHTLTPKI